MALARKTKVILVLIALIFLGLGFTALHARWYYGRSNGSRTGIVRKVSIKGPPYCKYVSAELAMQGSGIAQTEVFEFSIDDARETSPLLTELREAEKGGSRTTVKYRQDLVIWYRCSPYEYFVESIEK
jgi:hypothetical protein